MFFTWISFSETLLIYFEIYLFWNQNVYKGLQLWWELWCSSSCALFLPLSGLNGWNAKLLNKFQHLTNINITIQIFLPDNFTNQIQILTILDLYLVDAVFMKKNILNKIFSWVQWWFLHTILILASHAVLMVNVTITVWNVFLHFILNTN